MAVGSESFPSYAAASGAAGYPDATNTGVPPGTVMTKTFNGTLHITQDNAVISNMIINGNVVIEAKNVTMENVKINSTDMAHALRVMDYATGFTLMDSEIDGNGLGDNCIYGFGTFLRNNLHGAENGMTLWGPSVVQDNYIHGLYNAKVDPHYDGIQVNGGHDISFIHNTIINDYQQTSALMLENTFDGVSNITVYNNRLIGGGYTVYLDSRKGGGQVDDSSVNFLYNQIGGGYYGSHVFYSDHPGYYGNVGINSRPDLPDGASFIGTQLDDVLPDTGKSNDGNEVYLGLGGDDLLSGGAGRDLLNGGLGKDTASYVGSRAVTIDLAAGTASGGYANGDTLVSIENLDGSSRNDTLVGSDKQNVLRGNMGADTLSGGAGNDKLFGGAGKDTIDGGAGADRLDGGNGADTFMFHENTINGSADRIVNFSSGDSISFETTSGQSGHLNASAFAIGTDAGDSDDRFIYDTSSHALYYDSDGSGAAHKVLLATFDKDVTLTANDIWLV